MLALELRNNLLHPLHDLHIPLHGTSMYQGINLQIGVSIVIRTDLGDLDLRMKSRLGGLLLIEYLLIQLLPVRNPVNRISIPFTPLRRIIRSARSTIRTGLPISNTKISPPLPIVPASRTSLQASGISMKKRMISLCVTVTGPPRLICSLNNGITEPFDPSTLPKRVVTNCVRPLTFPSLIA